MGVGFLHRHIPSKIKASLTGLLPERMGISASN
jgi:hypothetical protein